jgi:predicted RNase H-like HicB family nuclease
MTAFVNSYKLRALSTSSMEKPMNLTIEYEQETDGRWIAEVLELPGVLSYGPSRDTAIAHVQALALRVLADRLEHDEAAPTWTPIAFAAAA